MKRAKLDKIFHPLHLSYFPEMWDDALVGWAEGANGPPYIPTYSYQAMKAILVKAGISPEEAYGMLYEILPAMGGEYPPLVVHSYSRKVLWEKITKNKFPRWDLLDKAIIGIGSIRSLETGVVYNRMLCADILYQSQSMSAELPEFQEKKEVHRFMDRSMVRVHMGKYSPYFVAGVRCESVD